MIIIGERINTSRKAIKEAVAKKDAEFIKNEAIKQKEAGANYIDVNCGTNVNTEIEDLKWAAGIVRSAVDLPLCIDSPNPAAVEAVLEMAKGEPFINSVTAEKARIEAVMPLAKKYKSFLVGLAMGDKGMPRTAQDRLEAAKIISDAAKKHGIDKDRLYIDAVVQPVSTDSAQGMEFLKAIRLIKQDGMKTIAGLSNVSFGLPKRIALNVPFLAMAIYAGIDAAIIDITNPAVFAALKASCALTGRDQFCQDYVAAFRGGKL